MKKITSRDLQVRFSKISKDILENDENYYVVRYGNPILKISNIGKDSPPGPPVVEKTPSVKSSPKISQKKMRVCVHGVVYRVGECGICGDNERNYKCK